MGGKSNPGHLPRGCPDFMMQGELYCPYTQHTAHQDTENSNLPPMYIDSAENSPQLRRGRGIYVSETSGIEWALNGNEEDKVQLWVSSRLKRGVVKDGVGKSFRRRMAGLGGEVCR